MMSKITLYHIYFLVLPSAATLVGPLQTAAVRTHLLLTITPLHVETTISSAEYGHSSELDEIPP